MNPGLEHLQPYPFERLAELAASVTPPSDRRTLSIGEPRHTPPAVSTSALSGALDGLAHSPASRGSHELREAIAQWLERRYPSTGHVRMGLVRPLDDCIEAARRIHRFVSAL